MLLLWLICLIIIFNLVNRFTIVYHLSIFTPEMTTCFRIFPNLAQNLPIREDYNSKDGRCAKWTKSGVVDGGGGWAIIIQHQKKKKWYEYLWFRGKNAHIFNCKFIGELYDLEGCINSTNEFSKSSDRGRGRVLYAFPQRLKIVTLPFAGFSQCWILFTLACTKIMERILLTFDMCNEGRVAEITNWLLFSSHLT